MDKKEATKVLAILRSIYPHIKIDNPEAMAAGWEMTLGEFSADAVMKAARLHIETSKYFPAPSEIREKIVRAELIYNGPAINTIEAHKQDPDREKYFEEYLDAFCQWIGFGCEANDDIPLPTFIYYET